MERSECSNYVKKEQIFFKRPIITSNELYFYKNAVDTKKKKEKKSNT